MAECKRKKKNLNPVVRMILRGLYDKDSPWHVLLGMHHILKAIWQDVLIYYKSKIAIPCDNEFSFAIFFGHSSAIRRDGKLFDLRFPESQDININMMPFVMAKRFKDTRLPDYLKQYFEQIVGPCIVESERGKIGYLTIHECFVEKGTSQRRPGIHTESPGVLMLKGGKGESKKIFKESPLRWGGGSVSITKTLQGGIYMASNVANSCKVWNCEILQPEGRNSPDVVGEHGDIEHLRSLLPEECETMDANTVYWMTDRTPHESLPLSEGTYRQYFRLVTSQVSDWFEDHSTKNPLGVVPDPKITKIIKGSKFDPDSCYIVDTAAE